MHLLLYATEFPRPLPDDDFRRLLDLLPGALQPKILRYRRWQDAHANLLGKHLLRLALDKAGAGTGLDSLHYTPEDKPYIPGGPHFNISHSGNRVVCLLSTAGRVGIDIEAVHPIAFEDFQTQFTQKEWTVIRSSPDPVTAFYHFWTAKESLIKADGRGLQIPLLGLDVSEARPILIDGASWQLRSLTGFPGYEVHIAFEQTPEPALTVHHLTPAELLALAAGI